MIPEGVAARMLAQHQPAFLEADRLRPNDLVGGLMLEDSVLVYPRFMGEGVGPDDGLVSGYEHPGQLAHQAAGAGDLPMIEGGGGLIVGLPCLQRHGHFFDGGVSGPLADPVDRSFHLVHPGLDGGESVGHGHAEIVVTVSAEPDLFYAGNPPAQLNEDVGVLLRRKIAHRVGKFSTSAPAAMARSATWQR